MKSNNNIIIGTFFVILGILFLLNNFNLFNFNFRDVFRLWPIVLIYIGVGMLPIETKMKAYLEAGVIALFFILLITLPYIKPNYHYQQNDYEFKYDNEDNESGIIFDAETKQIDLFIG